MLEEPDTIAGMDPALLEGDWLDDEPAELTMEQLLAAEVPFHFARDLMKASMPSKKAAAAAAGPLSHVSITGDVSEFPPGFRIQRIYPASRSEQFRGWLHEPAAGQAASHQETGPGALDRLTEWLWDHQPI